MESALSNEPPAQGSSEIEALLRPTEVAAALGVSRSWLYDAAKDGRIPSVRLGGPDGPLRFVKQDLTEWLERARAGWLPGDRPSQTLARAASRRDPRGGAPAEQLRLAERPASSGERDG